MTIVGDGGTLKEVPERSPAAGSSAERPSPDGSPVGQEPDGYPPEESVLPGRPGSDSAGARQYRSRSERRTYRRAVRRRKLRRRIGIVFAGTVIVVAVVVALFLLLGGPEMEEVVATTVPVGNPDPDALLVIEQDGAIPVMLLFHPREATGVVLAMPGLTLLKTSEGFKTLAELQLVGQEETLQTALAEALQVQIGAPATVEWAALLEAAERSEIAGPAPETLSGDAGEALRVGRLVLALVGAGAGSEGAQVWAGVPLGGDAEGFREALGASGRELGAGGGDAAELTGRLVEGTGFQYLEPDVQMARALLTGTTEATGISLQVLNGSGEVGIAQEVGALLGQLGYTMLPAGNAPGFPDVEQTRIETSPDAVAHARQVRALLGGGLLDEEPSLESGQVVVILGKDYVLPATTSTGPVDEEAP